MMETQEWRDSVDEKLRKLDERCQSHAEQITEAANTVIRLAADVGAALAIHAANAEQIANNTKITLDVSKKLDELDDKVMPVVHITQSMTKGAAAFGKMITFFERWGARIVRIFIFFCALWLGAKVLMSGAGWTEAIRIFIGVQGK